MNDSQTIAQEQRVLRWGGLAGIVGGILLVAVFVIVGVFVGPDPAEPEGLVMRFPDVGAAHAVEEVMYLGVLALWVIHFLALYRALRGTSLAPALFGSALGIMGLGVLAAGALPRVARTPRSPTSITLLGDPRGSGDARPPVAGDPGHLRCVAGRRTSPPARGCHRPRGGHAGGSGLRQRCCRSGPGDRGIGARSRGCPADRPWLPDRHRQRSVTHRLPPRPGLEGLRSVEGDRRRFWIRKRRTAECSRFRGSMDSRVNGGNEMIAWHLLKC
jgi:hypothetical protein